jgi:acyl carrier protein
MSEERSQVTYDKESLYKLFVECLETVVPDVKEAFNSIELNTNLGRDLNLQSIEFVRLVATVQRKLEGVKLPFQELFVTPDGSPVEDITVEDVVDFLYKNLT